MTSLREILKHLDTIAPREFTLEGLEGIVEVGPSTHSEQSKTTINRIVVATYPSAKAVAKASQEKANLLISYRPMFGKPIKQISDLNLVRLRLLAKNYISTYVIGSPWISAKDGLTDALVDALNLKQTNNFTAKGIFSNTVPIGRFCESSSVMNHSGFANYIASKLEIPSVNFTGNLDDETQQIMVCVGCTVTSELLFKAIQENAKTIITGEVLPEIRMKAHEVGMNLFEIGTFAAEAPGMKRLRHQMSLEYPELKIEYTDTDVITQSLRPYSKDMA
ncbi:MAG: Nif3-like dinuclear metal center hexameric protein [Candidatus Thorarchaeota archaeon]|nr:Nif3-like dinuclear metal center hexameric protein [Candidatus Thorarchaeota archaeon]